MLVAQFYGSRSGWIIQFFWDGEQLNVQYLLSRIKQFLEQNTTRMGGNYKMAKMLGSITESGCGAQISWSTMLLVDSEIVQSLGTIEIQAVGCLEEQTRSSFNERLHQHMESNLKILKDGLHHQK